MRMYYLIPLFLALFINNKITNALIIGFMAGSIILLSISMLMYITNTPLFKASGNNWVVFHLHGYHTFFISIFAFLLLAGILTKKLPRYLLIASTILFLIAAFNILFLTTSRTGQILFFAMLFTSLFIYNKKIGSLIGITILILGGILLPNISDNIKSRFSEMTNDIKQYDEGNYASSTGIRLEYHKNTLQLISESPLYGHGTGSFTSEYNRFLKKSDTIILPHPHNDYLLLTSETGMIGGLLLFVIIGSVIYQTKEKPLSIKLAIYPILTHMTIGTLANSLFTDNVTSVGFVLLTLALLNLDNLPWEKHA
jgi:O-antigen ligase